MRTFVCLIEGFTLHVLFILIRKGNGTFVNLTQSGRIHISCEYTIKELQLISTDINANCNSAFHAWKLLCHDKLDCLVQNTCNETVHIKYLCRDRLINYEALITDPDPQGIKFNCTCQCIKNGLQNSTYNGSLLDMNCSCICEDRQVTFLQANSRSMGQRLIELHENLTIAKRKTTKYKRMKKSATDNRKSSTTIGVFGIIILSVVIGSIILMDIPRLYQMIMSIQSLASIVPCH